MAKTTKTEVVEYATLQSQRAQRVTAALRAHGWRTSWSSGKSVPNDDGWRAAKAREALHYAELVARDADTILSHVRAWAIQEGALNAPERG